MSATLDNLEPLHTTSANKARLRTLLIGAGSLGRAFLQRMTLPDANTTAELVGVITGHRGRRTSSECIKPEDALVALEGEGLETTTPLDFKRILEETRPHVVVECVPQNIRSGEPSLTFLRAALDFGAHAVTANKAAIALGYRDLRHRAARQHVTFRFEATVLDGLPLFLFLSRIPNPEVRRIRGVLNGTSSLVLESVQLGSTRTRGLARAQAQGIAEADSVLDVDGWDCAAKAALLANVYMNGTLRVSDVVREGCDAIKDEDLRRAGDAVHYRLVTEVVRLADSGAMKANVRLAAIEPGDPFFALRGSAGGITIECAHGPSLTMLQGTHGLQDAANGIFLDVMAIADGAPQV